MRRLFYIVITLLLAACQKEAVPATDGSMTGQVTTNCTACTVTVTTNNATTQTLDMPNTTARLYFKYDKATVVTIAVTPKTNQTFNVAVWDGNSIQVYQSANTTVNAETSQSFTYWFNSK